MPGCLPVAIVTFGLILACDPSAPPASNALSLLPADYLQRFVEVRGCRPSIDHDLQRIVIKTEPGTLPRYQQGPFPLDTGALIVKEEFADPDCRLLSGWTLMRKEPAGYDDRSGNWRWQRLDAAGKVLEDGKLPRCAGCHAAAACQVRDFTCAEP
jgi:hypothetical protein